MITDLSALLHDCRQRFGANVTRPGFWDHVRESRLLAGNTNLKKYCEMLYSLPDAVLDARDRAMRRRLENLWQYYSIIALVKRSGIYTARREIEPWMREFDGDFAQERFGGVDWMPNSLPVELKESWHTRSTVKPWRIERTIRSLWAFLDLIELFDDDLVRAGIDLAVFEHSGTLELREFFARLTQGTNDESEDVLRRGKVVRGHLAGLSRLCDGLIALRDLVERTENLSAPLAEGFVSYHGAFLDPGDDTVPRLQGILETLGALAAQRSRANVPTEAIVREGVPTFNEAGAALRFLSEAGERLRLNSRRSTGVQGVRREDSVTPIFGQLGRIVRIDERRDRVYIRVFGAEKSTIIEARQLGAAMDLRVGMTVRFFIVKGEAVITKGHWPRQRFKPKPILSGDEWKHRPD